MKDLKGLISVFGEYKCHHVYVKELRDNDNSKNQIYLGTKFDALNIIPYGKVELKKDKRANYPNLKAKVDLYWINTKCEYAKAPYARLILYHDYPEIRLSGFLRACPTAPDTNLSIRSKGRILFLGITDSRQIFAYLAMPDSAIARGFQTGHGFEKIGLFWEIALQHGKKVGDTRSILIENLRRIYEKGWINSRKLDTHGNSEPCNSTNCGGYTLEAELGIKPNGYSEPDFMGWEIKQHGVVTLNNPKPGRITLFTPEPKAGVYADEGPEEFLRKFGYKDKKGIPDRINFGGVYKVDASENKNTGLNMRMRGFDRSTEKITDPKGGLYLLSRNNEIAAVWNFSDLMEIWNRKHAQAAYVPSVHQKNPNQYRYGKQILLGTGTRFEKLLTALSKGTVYYDPGIKMENASSEKPFIKRRSQFRTKHGSLEDLYDKLEEIDLDSPLD